MSPRIRRVLKLVEELEPAACADPADRALAETIKRRIDAAARGETRMVPTAEAYRILCERQKARRTALR